MPGAEAGRFLVIIPSSRPCFKLQDLQKASGNLSDALTILELQGEDRERAFFHACIQ